MLIWRCQRVTSSAQYVTPAKIFLTSKFSYLLFFCNPVTLPIQVKLRLQIAGSSSKPSGPSIMKRHSKTGKISQVIFITLFFSRWAALLYLLPASANCAHMLGQNHFAQPNGHVWLFFVKFLILRATYWALLGMLLGPKLSPILMRDFAILWNYGIWKKLDRRWRQLISYFSKNC